MNRRDFIGAIAASTAALPASGEQAEPRPKSPRPLTITLLGTGTPAPSLSRQSSGYVIEVGDDLIVWDHGPIRLIVKLPAPTQRRDIAILME